jgi:hypothetical protein
VASQCSVHVVVALRSLRLTLRLRTYAEGHGGGYAAQTLGQLMAAVGLRPLGGADARV